MTGQMSEYLSLGFAIGGCTKDLRYSFEDCVAAKPSSDERPTAISRLIVNQGRFG